MKIILQTARGVPVHTAVIDEPPPGVVTLGPATFIYFDATADGAVYRETTAIALPSPLAAMRAARTPAIRWGT